MSIRDPLYDCLAMVKRGSRPRDADIDKAINRYKHLRDLEQQRNYQSKQDPRKNRHAEARESQNQVIITLQHQVAELRDRLSSMAGAKMQDGNPNITDLNDPFRPTKVVEQFRELYDNEWTMAYDQLQKGPLSEAALVTTLADIAREAFKFCEELARQQMGELQKFHAYFENFLTNPTYKISDSEMIGSERQGEPDQIAKDTISKYLKDYRKALSRCSLPAAKDIFLQWARKTSKVGLREVTGDVKSYVERVVELAWLMRVQDPPVVPQWAGRGEALDRDKFSCYTRTGTVVLQTVWPAILLHTGGPLMAKGIVDVR